jgi:thiol-disulfide isomerase/thioredoxin
MIRKLVSLVVPCIFLALTGCNNETAKIAGSLANATPGEYIYLDAFKASDLERVDSVRIGQDGGFKFKAEVKNPSFYLLKLNNNNFLTMLVEPGQDLFITAHHDSLNYPVTVEGSEGTGQMAEYNKKLRSTIDHIKALNKIYEDYKNDTGLPELMQSLDSMAQGYLGEMNLYTKDYINKNIKSLVSLVALYQQIAPGVYILDQSKDLKYFTRVDSSLYRTYPDYEPVVTLHQQVSELVSSMGMNNTGVLQAGDVAPEIALPTPAGDTISLSSTRGSVVLVDFWASWCPPCRAESRNLVKAYDQYHKRGFQIFQVSLDKTRDAWIKGIEDDQLGRWIHVSDIQYWNSVVVPLYKIEAIPTNYLIDREGKVIDSNLRGDRLQQVLSEVFNK